MILVSLQKQLQEQHVNLCSRKINVTVGRFADTETLSNRLIVRRAHNRRIVPHICLEKVGYKSTNNLRAMCDSQEHFLTMKYLSKLVNNCKYLRQIDELFDVEFENYKDVRCYVRVCIHCRYMYTF